MSCQLIISAELDTNLMVSLWLLSGVFQRDFPDYSRNYYQLF